jgi:thiaminase/transcriptional activator TenA
VSFCESLRAQSRELWQTLHEHPFLLEMADGTLPLGRFRFYLEQDLFFLPELARAVALGVARAEDGRQMRHFAEEIGAVVERELGNNERLLTRVLELGAPDGDGARAAAPATVAYGGFLVSTASKGGPLEIMTALLPCTWSYADIAGSLRGRVSDHPVYTDWVGFFASEEYVALIESRRAILDRLAAGASAARRARLASIFAMSTRLEHAFWEMAYRLEQWPDLREVA